MLSQKGAEALRRQILELEQVRAQTTVEPPAPDPARSAGGRSAGAFWSPAPILGFRMWRLTSLGVRGVVQVWEEPRLEARCPRGPGAPHDAPCCRCGIYAFKDAGALWGARPGAWPGIIYGLVALSGKVIEHEHGYRAQRAEVPAVALMRDGALVCRSDPKWIARLFAPGLGWEEAQRAGGVRAGRPGLPVCAVEYLTDEARRFGEVWTSESRSG
ncbi:MAG: hypothetical protein ABIJ48_00675 [Actinomycetota bacterium]